MSQIIEKFRKHWLVAMIVLCVAVSTGTWQLAVQLLVVPRDFEIKRLEKLLDHEKSISIKKELTPLMGSDNNVENYSILKGTAVTTSDGGCVIIFYELVGDTGAVSLGVTIDTNESEHVIIQPGDREVFTGINGVYFIDVHGGRGNLVDISVVIKPGSVVKSNQRNLFWVCLFFGIQIIFKPVIIFKGFDSQTLSLYR